MRRFLSLCLLAAATLIPANLGTAQFRSPRVRIVTHRRVPHRVRAVRPPVVTVGHHDYGHRRRYRRSHRSRGYWKIVVERVWCPAVYEWRRDSCGRYYRYCVRRGYYDSVERRVWVDGCGD